MNAKKCFVDSNVILYLFGADENKKKVAHSFLDSRYLISTQVINENVNVCIKKLRLTKEEAFSHGQNLIEQLSLTHISTSTIQQAFRISSVYNYADSLIISAALENGCEILFSEDMSNDQTIDGKLKIVNPFI